MTSVKLVVVVNQEETLQIFAGRSPFDSVLVKLTSFLAILSIVEYLIDSS